MKHPGKNWNLRMMIDNSSMLRICLLIFVYMLVNMFVKLELVAEQESSFLTSKRWKIDNLPEEYLEHSNRELDAEATKEEHCGKYPELWDLQFSNNHWQVYERKRDVFYLAFQLRSISKHNFSNILTLYSYRVCDLKLPYKKSNDIFMNSIFLILKLSYKW